MCVCVYVYVCVCVVSVVMYAFVLSHMPADESVLIRIHVLPFR